MYTPIKNINSFLIIPIYWFCLVFCNVEIVIAGQRFTSSHPCSDTGKVCVSGGGTRKIDGFDVYRDCWQWSYTKTCNYPSKNDCGSYSHCYFVANGNCLLTDSRGSCVNQQREFSCKRKEQITITGPEVRTGLKEKEGPDQLVCTDIPCIDGNCVDKSYTTNGEMMDSISRLYAISKMKPDKDGNFSLFQGSGQHCSKKATSYTNCCSQNPKGWGKEIGAKCSKDETLLAERRARNLCVYVGKEKVKSLGVTTVVKHHFCCWGNMLDKVVQVQGRKQLGINFGSGGSPNCRGLTLEEIQRIDWEQVDFTEFIEDFKFKFFGSYKAPSSAALGKTVKQGVSGIRTGDTNPDNQDNNRSGVNEKAVRQ